MAAFLLTGSVGLCVILVSDSVTSVASTEGRCELKGKVMMPEAKKGRKPIQLAVFVEQSNAMVGLNPGGRLRLLRMFEHIYANP